MKLLSQDRIIPLTFVIAYMTTETKINVVSYENIICGLVPHLISGFCSSYNLR